MAELQKVQEPGNNVPRKEIYFAESFLKFNIGVKNLMNITGFSHFSQDSESKMCS